MIIANVTALILGKQDIKKVDLVLLAPMVRRFFISENNDPSSNDNSNKNDTHVILTYNFDKCDVKKIEMKEID